MNLEQIKKSAQKREDLCAITVAVRLSGLFRKNVWDPLLEQLGSKVSVTKTLKEAILLRAAAECEGAKVFIRTADGVEHDLREFLGIGK